ncbi:MAG: winged helix-turn-helix domain-containing protein [Nitrosarchaeum sp.]|jgi:restriction system protein|uniref:winged helix-turn-helix domain-containing protein n=1 Tax=Nitrosarchaeum sp. TaxID=2026886 RepID=UPI002DE81279|nr:winged helix-turn-helix domain-containing protein [Nitrosarchaeum sp.]
MAIPNQKDIGLPILELLKDRKNHHVEEISKTLAERFGLSEEERSLQKSSGGEGLFHNRIRWANFYLRKAGLVESAKGTGNSKITQEGINLLKEKPDCINAEFLMRYPMFVEYKKSVSRKK